MKLSTKGKYGVKAMVDLAINYGDKPVSIKAISQRQNISDYYLEQLFSSLRKAKLIRSIRGAQGGYVLNRTPEEITVADIMEVLEGPIEIAECLEGVSCDRIDCCATKLLWEKIKNSIDDVMKSVTLQDIINDAERIEAEKLEVEKLELK